MPRLEGPVQAGLPWEESDWRLLSQSVSPADGWPPVGAVYVTTNTGSSRIDGYGLEGGEERTRMVEHQTAWVFPPHTVAQMLPQNCFTADTPLKPEWVFSLYSMLWSYGSLWLTDTCT